MGELTLQLGMPGAGWGPAPLGPAALAAALERLTAAADAAGADLTVLRQRPLPPDVLAGTSAGAAGALSPRGGSGGGEAGAPVSGGAPAGSADAAAQQEGCGGYVLADVLVRQRSKPRPPLEVRVAVVGNVDSGKSTLVGVLTRSTLDDGRGLARSKVRVRSGGGGVGHGHQDDAGGRRPRAGGCGCC
jgi:hypothetical protein